MPSKKEKHHQILTDVKSQTIPLANSTNTTPTSNPNVSLSNSYHSITTNHFTTTTKKKTTLKNDSINNFDHLSLIRDQKHELDELNNRFSNYVNALRKKSKENDDLQKKVDAEKQKQKNLSNEKYSDLETKMNELRNDIDESALLTEHFILKRNRTLKEISSLKDKIRIEEDRSYAHRRQALENEYKQTSIQLKELTQRFQDLENLSKTNKDEMNQMNDLYNKLEDELHDLILNNIRLEWNLRTIEEKTLLKKAIYETEKVELANEQIKLQEFYTDELDKAIEDIKRDFQALLQNNKVILENAYTERIEQVKTQISTYQTNQKQESPSTLRMSMETLHDEIKQVERARDDIEHEYGPLIELYTAKQKEKYQFDEERIRLDSEYNRLINEINHLSEAIENGKQYWFSVRFELETYKRLLDLQTTESTTNYHNTSVSNGKGENGLLDEQQQIITVKKVDSQRAISKTGKFDIDQVQAGFISINNSSTNCVDQPLKGWTLVRSVNDGQEDIYHFPDTYVLNARTRVRVYSNKSENVGNSSASQGRFIAPSISAWASTGQGENVKILLLDNKGIKRAQYTETWQ